MYAKEISETNSLKKRCFEDMDFQKFASGETFVSGRLANLPNFRWLLQCRRYCILRTIIMAQTLVEIIIHVIFSTKNRENFIAPEIEKELFAYIGGILRKHESVLLAANGTENHIHLLILQSKKIALSDLIREIKRASSLWIKQKSDKFSGFQWQGGFGAFSVSKIQIEIVKKYIANQKEHHKTENFDDEYRKFLKRYEMDFDEKYFLD